MQINFAILLALVAGCWAIEASNLAAADTPPNIVLIISDDQAWTDYGFMGHPQIQTPSIDKLAKQSLTFSRGYVPNSLCRPSLATMVTGLYTHQHKIVGNDPPPPADLLDKPKGRQFADPRYLPIRQEYLKHIDRVPKLAEILGKELGYVSHQSGKWWEGHYSKGGFTNGMTHGDRTRGGRHGDEGLKIGRQGMEPVFDFIDTAQQGEKPFFVYYAPFMPHTPHNPPERLLAKYRDKTPHLPIAKYWAMCEWFDETVGQLLDHLDKRELSDNTIVLYVCDNGWINDTKSSRYLPRSKRSQYDGGVRTPIMVRWSGKVEPRLEKTELASSIDLVPTVLAAVGLEPTEAMQGIDLLDREAVENRDTIYGDIFEHDIRHMTDPVPSLRFRWVIEGPWKLIVPHRAVEPEAEVELFHLLDDPDEQKNLAADKPDLVARLSKKIDAWWPATSESGESR